MGLFTGNANVAVRFAGRDHVQLCISHMTLVDGAMTDQHYLLRYVEDTKSGGGAGGGGDDVITAGFRFDRSVDGVVHKTLLDAIHSISDLPKVRVVSLALSQFLLHCFSQFPPSAWLRSQSYLPLSTTSRLFVSA